MQVLDEFSKQVDRIDWPVGSPDTIQYTALDGHLSRYQVSLEKCPLETASTCCGLGKLSNQVVQGWCTVNHLSGQHGLRVSSRQAFEFSVLCLFIVRVGSASLVQVCLQVRTPLLVLLLFWFLEPPRS